MDIELSRAEQLLMSSEESARWKGAALLGERAESQPELIWPLVVRFGSSDAGEVRSAIACCVLEHVLEFHFDRYFQEVERLATSSSDFADTVSQCWPFGQTEQPEKRARFDALRDAARTV